MLTKRIIACLDVDGGRVVKGVQFENLRDAGDPAELARAHSAAGADEVICDGINSCKGQGSCAGKGHACAGQNGCKGKGFIDTSSSQECTQKGGTPVTG